MPTDQVCGKDIYTSYYFIMTEIMSHCFYYYCYLLLVLNLLLLLLIGVLGVGDVT